MQKQAKVQIEEYAEFDEIKAIPNLHKYTIVAVNDELFVEEVWLFTWDIFYKKCFIFDKNKKYKF